MAKMTKKEIAEKVRKGRELNAKVKKLNEELAALKTELLGAIGVGESVMVDNVKALVYETKRTTLLRDKIEELWGQKIPTECEKVSTSAAIKLG